MAGCGFFSAGPQHAKVLLTGRQCDRLAKDILPMFKQKPARDRDF
jgi:hypothetical protein